MCVYILRCICNWVGIRLLCVQPFGLLGWELPCSTGHPACCCCCHQQDVQLLKLCVSHNCSSKNHEQFSAERTGAPTTLGPFLFGIFERAALSRSAHCTTFFYC